MKKRLQFTVVALLLAFGGFAQEQEEGQKQSLDTLKKEEERSTLEFDQDEDWYDARRHRRNRDRYRDREIRTIFNNPQHPTGYGALTNKFTMIRGQYANLAGVYGGVYLNHVVFLGVGASAVTNNLPVPTQYSVDPTLNLSWEYGQVGLVTEVILASHRAFHVGFNMFAGPGFTIQYQRYGYKDFNFGTKGYRDENWFMVAEPGVQLEVNIFRWMRFSPGLSYRATFGSNAAGLSDSDLSGITYNATLKFGRF